MTNQTATAETSPVTNGIEVGKVMGVIGNIQADPDYAKFQFRASNHWVDGSISRSRIQGFYAGNAEDTTRSEPFVIDADEPLIAAGRDSAPNAVEYLLHALATCLTGTLAYHAAVRGIEIESIESFYRGDIDVRGLFGLSEEVPKGLNKVQVEMRVKSAASAEELTELAMFSPVYEMVSKAVPVEFSLTTL